MSKQEIYDELLVIANALGEYCNNEVELNHDVSSTLWLISDDLKKITSILDEELLEENKE